jgi:thioredoxin 1
MAQIINSENFEQLVATGKPIVLDFWATWCGPCRRLGPIIEELAHDYEGQAVIGKCNIEEDEDLPVRFKVVSIPTVLFIKDGQVVDKIVGAAARPAYEEKLKNIL